MIYALDSNTITYILRDEGKVRSNFNYEIIECDNYYAIPFMVMHEVKRWLLYKPTKTLKAYNQEFDKLFLSVKHRAEIPISVWEKTTDVYIALKSKGQLIGNADILIASYCLVNNYTLITRNISDFERIDGLKFNNWY